MNALCLITAVLETQESFLSNNNQEEEVKCDQTVGINGQFYIKLIEELGLKQMMHPINTQSIFYPDMLFLCVAY